MELHHEILAQIASNNQCQNCLLRFSGNEAMERVCYSALKKIKAVIEDDSLNDPECFYKIESIVCILEEIGSDGGFRHDFG